MSDRPALAPPPPRSAGADAPPHVAAAGPRTRMLRGAAVLALVLGAVLLVRWIGPRPSGLYPRCPFNVLTGLLCPGCGATRAVHALLHGEFARAWCFNPLLLALLPLVGWWAGRAFAWVVGLAAPPAALPRRLAIGLFVAILVFSVVRNLPWWPWPLPPG